MGAASNTKQAKATKSTPKVQSKVEEAEKAANAAKTSIDEAMQKIGLWFERVTAEKYRVHQKQHPPRGVIGCCYEYGIGKEGFVGNQKAYGKKNLMRESRCPTSELRLGGGVGFLAGVSCAKMPWAPKTAPKSGPTKKTCWFWQKTC